MVLNFGFWNLKFGVWGFEFYLRTNLSVKLASLSEKLSNFAAGIFY